MTFACESLIFHQTVHRVNPDPVHHSWTLEVSRTCPTIKMIPQQTRVLLLFWVTTLSSLRVHLKYLPLAVVRIKVLFKHAIWLRRGAPCPLWPVEFAGQWLFTLHNDQNSQGTPMPLDSRTDIHPLSAPWLAAVFGASWQSGKCPLPLRTSFFPRRCWV